MPITPTTGISIAAIVIIIGALAAVSYQHRLTAAKASPSPTSNVASDVTLTMSPTPALFETSEPTMSFTPISNSTSSHISINQQTTTTATTPRPTPQVTTTPTTEPGTTRQIVFIDTPTTVQSGQPFTVTWRIEGPAGETGSQTTIKTHFAVAQDSGGSHSSSTTDNTNSFGSFTVPATYSSNLNYSGNNGTIEVTITAEVNGQTLTAQRNISLVD